MNAGPLDEVPDDLPLPHVLRDDVLGTLRIDVIIQSGRTPRARDRRKPAAERGHRLRGEDLPDQDVGALRAPTKAALPRDLGVLSRTVVLERVDEHGVERLRSTAAAALGAAADDDLEPAHVWARG
ncbi:MAG TPA: hypothetical protein VFP84_08430 [Kofleriaceae bacterium]|nr:hypothetical protein [Kofleriaceae bacterium]